MAEVTEAQSDSAPVSEQPHGNCKTHLTTAPIPRIDLIDRGATADNVGVRPPAGTGSPWREVATAGAGGRRAYVHPGRRTCRRRRVGGDAGRGWRDARRAVTRRRGRP